MERDRHKQLLDHASKVKKEKQKALLNKKLRTEVEINANGSSKYTIKEGINKGKVV